MRTVALLCIGITLFFIDNALAQSNAGLIAHWRFSNNVVDSAGTHHGTANNITYTAGRRGLPNTAASFNGTSSYISVPYQSDLNLTEYSICATVQPKAFYTGLCQTNSILWRGVQGTSSNYGLYIYDNPYDGDCNIVDTSRNVFASSAGVFTSSNNNQWKYSPNVITGNWYSVVATYKNDTIRIYVNGVKKSTFVGTGPLSSSTEGLYIGANYNGTSGSYPYWFNGLMDDIRLYNRQLADSETKQYYCEAYMEPPLPTTLCKTVPFNITYTAVGIFDVSNSFLIQLSDASGSWASPMFIGASAATGSGTITCNVPGGVPIGTGYKIRLVSTSPSKIYDEANVSVYIAADSPKIMISVAPSTAVISGGSTFFSAIPSNGGTSPTYQWRKNRQHIPGANGITYSAVAGTDFVTNDTIDCVIRSNTVCATPDSAVSNPKVMVVFTVGIDGITGKNEISVFPNPNKGSFTIKGKCKGEATLTIFNTVGQAIHSDIIKAENGEINRNITMPNVPAGIYYLRMNVGETLETYKLHVE